MAPKKKAKGVKSKKASKADGGSDALRAVEPPLLIEPPQVDYVTLDMRLLNWSYLNFKIRVKTTTRLFAIKQEIRKRHGPVVDLKICKDHFAEANEMVEDLATLEDYGIQGAPEGEEPTYIVHYDFKPQEHDNPLLLASEAP